MPWHSSSLIQSKQYRCGFCGNIVASATGFFENSGRNRVYICPHCEKPSYFDQNGNQFPGISPGNEVNHLPDELQALYREARNCVSVGAYTSSVLACRKLLMNIAVAQKAEPGKPFIAYVEHLSNAGYVPPNGRGWVDHIRKKGNEATHEIALMSQEDSEELISFCEMLLKFVYEFPAQVPSKSASQVTPIK